MENIPPNELNILLCRFFMDVRKKDGGVYEPGTLCIVPEKYSALVHLYLKFASHRPEEMKRPEAPFFLVINHKRKPADPVWYSRAPLGKNKIGEAAKYAGLPQNVTNHSVRKTCISRLMDAEIPVYYVAQRSGHKNSKSLDSYKTASFRRPPAQDVLATEQRNEISHLFKRCTA